MKVRRCYTMKEQEFKMYAVTCKCGHVGANNYLPITFPLIAMSAKEAASKARCFPRVKRQCKDCILDVKKITKFEFDRLYVLNSIDPYLQCQSSRDLKLANVEERIVRPVDDDSYYDCTDEAHHCHSGKMVIKNLKKFIRNNEERRINN